MVWVYITPRIFCRSMKATVKNKLSRTMLSFLTKLSAKLSRPLTFDEYSLALSSCEVFPRNSSAWWNIHGFDCPDANSCLLPFPYFASGLVGSWLTGSWLVYFRHWARFLGSFATNRACSWSLQSIHQVKFSRCRLWKSSLSRVTTNL